MYVPTVVQAVAGDDFTVYAYFSDGTVRLCDAKPLIARGGVFARIADEHVFKSSLTVMNGAIAWDIEGNRDEARCIDVDPVVSYETGVIVPDPLGDVA